PRGRGGKQRTMRLSSWLVVVVLVGALAGCQYNTDRTKGLLDGEITGTALREDGSPAQGALIAVAGSQRVVAADAHGNFAVTDLVPGTWILHITEDDQGDGVPERAAFVSATARFVPIKKNLTDGLTSAPPSAITSELLGTVKLATTAHIKGSVAVAVGEEARVIAWRDVADHAAPIEASAHVSAVDGSFDLAGVAPGAVHVAALSYDPLEHGADATRIVHFGVVDASAGDSAVHITPDQSARTDSDATKLRTFSVQLDAQWDSTHVQAVTLALATFTAPGHDDDELGNSPDGAQLDAAQSAFVLDVSAGVVDISLQSATDGVVDGLLRGALALPDVAVLGPVELPRLADPCDDGAGGRDCDHDGLQGLPFPDDGDAAVAAQYHACAAECADKLGPALVGATCTVDGKKFDCDDDGDGQPDVTEGAACLGPGLGTDLDGDDLCEPNADPFPNCLSNLTADCENASFHKPVSRYP
ncbi:MAG TPA: carboxypeptidase-like regulatory domain-containing protein, partial [Myxococcota bacterium]